jgi:GT2 family glycosyltransferase
MATTEPLVRVVVLNFDGGQMTIDCLRSLLASDWPADRLEVVLVDNGSLDDVVDRIRVELPSVRVIEPMSNTGFAGGCNLGIKAAGEVDLVALVNNDAIVEPDWLRPLVKAVEEDAAVGAACCRMLFAGRYVEVEVDVPDAAAVGDDPRKLGVRLVGARIEGERADDRLAFDEGFFGAELPHRPSGEEMARWSRRRGRIRIRVDDDTVPASISLCLTSIGTRHARLRTPAGTVDVVLDGHPVWLEVPLAGPPLDIINNVGSALYPRGFGGDRGFLEVDRGQYDEPADVFAWCGGAVLLRREYLDDVGLLDERLFLYYEDTDHSWRGLLHGWRYRYVPASVVHHRHAQSSVVGSPVFGYYTQRNRPLMLAKNAPATMAARAGGGLLRRAVTTTLRDLVVRPVTLRMPRRAVASQDWRVLVGYVQLLPAMLRDRRRAAPLVERASIVRRWEQPPKVTAG